MRAYPRQKKTCVSPLDSVFGLIRFCGAVSILASGHLRMCLPSNRYTGKNLTCTATLSWIFDFANGQPFFGIFRLIIVEVLVIDDFITTVYFWSCQYQSKYPPGGATCVLDLQDSLDWNTKYYSSNSKEISNISQEPRGK